MCNFLKILAQLLYQFGAWKGYIVGVPLILGAFNTDLALFNLPCCL